MMLKDILEIFDDEVSKKEKHAIVSLNWSLAVILVRFADGTGEESAEMEEANEGENKFCRSENMKITNLIYLFLVIFEIIFQVIGGISYDIDLSWIWPICDASILMIPLMFGLKKGILACLPNTIAEIVWFIAYGYGGALIHGFTFLFSVIILGLILKFSCNLNIKWQMIVKGVSFEVLLLGEEFVYCLLRVIFGINKISYISWDRISVDFLSVGNVLGLICILLWTRFINCKESSR